MIVSSLGNMELLKMIKLADEIAIGYASKGGMLERLVAEVENKKVINLSHDPETL